MLVIVAVDQDARGRLDRPAADPDASSPLFNPTRRHYDHVAAELTLRDWRRRSARPHNTVIIPIGGIQRAVVEALRYAETLSDDVRAVYVDVDPAATERCEAMAAWGGGVQLVVLPSPYRSLMEPLLEYIEQAAAGRPDDYVTVILPEFVPRRLWQHLLHNQHALLIKAACCSGRTWSSRACHSISGRGRREFAEPQRVTDAAAVGPS